MVPRIPFNVRCSLVVFPVVETFKYAVRLDVVSLFDIAIYVLVSVVIGLHAYLRAA